MKKRILFLLLFLLVICHGSIVHANKNTSVNLNIDDLENGFYYNEKLLLLDDSLGANYNKVVGLNDGYLVVGSIKIANDGKTLKYPYIAYFVNDERKWFDTIENHGTGEFVDVIIKESIIIACGSVTYENEQSLIVEYNYQGEINKLKKMNTNGKTKINEIIDYNDYYLIVGTTTATNECFSFHKENNRVIFLLSLSKDLEIIESSVFGNSGNNDVISICKEKDNFFIYCTLSGEGYFKLDNSNQKCIVTCSSRCEVIDYYNILNFYGTTGLINIDGIVYFYHSKENKICIDFYKVDYDYIKYIKSYNTSLSNGYVYNCYVSYKNNNIIILEKIGIGYNKYIYITMYNKDQMVFQYKSLIDDGFDPENLLFENEEIIYYGKSDNGYDIYKLINIKKIENIILFNGQEIKDSEQIISDKYGYYDSINVYNFGKEVFNVNSTFYVKPEISIKDNETYDINVVISANSNFKINNKLVDNNYIIKEEGVYVIELIGNNETSIYTIEVKKLTESINDIEDYKIDLSVAESANDIDENNSKIEYMILADDAINDISKGTLVILLFGVIGLILGIFLPFKKKRGKE